MLSRPVFVPWWERDVTLCSYWLNTVNTEGLALLVSRALILTGEISPGPYTAVRLGWSSISSALTSPIKNGLGFCDGLSIPLLLRLMEKLLSLDILTTEK